MSCRNLALQSFILTVFGQDIKVYVTGLAIDLCIAIRLSQMTFKWMKSWPQVLMARS